MSDKAEHTARAHLWACGIFPCSICTTTLPDHAHQLIARRHAQAVVQAEIGAGRPFGGATAAMLRRWIAWRECVVECCAVESIALLADRNTNEGSED